jgi:ribose 5-phosphate isomerase B
MKIGICSDHAGVEYKAKLIKYLQGRGIEVVNFGTDTTESMDYPDVAHPLASAVESGSVDLGIALCGTGNGMAITLNKHQGIRAGLAWGTAIGKLVKQHNNANVLVLPTRFISYRMAVAIVRTWLDTDFEGGRHQRRIDKIPCR